MAFLHRVLPLPCQPPCMFLLTMVICFQQDKGNSSVIAHGPQKPASRQSPSSHPCARCSPECLSGPVCPLCALSSSSSLRCPRCLRLRSLLPVWRKLPFLSMPMLPHFSLTEKLFGFVVHTDSSGEPRYENPPLSPKSLNPGENSEIQKEHTVI